MLITVAEAKARIDSGVVPLPPERVPLETALAEGRTLRQDVEADADSPAFDRSAMDGYAVAEGEGVFRVVGSVRAGEVYSGEVPLRPGTCVRIFTGAAVPEGTIRVVMQEESKAERETVVFSPGALEEGRPLYLRRRGEEYRRGGRLIGEGTRVGPVEASVLAMGGTALPWVGRRPRVTHVVTGGELVPPDGTPRPGQIRDSNSSLVAGLIARAGAALVRQVRVGDDGEALRREVGQATAEGSDLLLISGGAGEGETDFGRRTLEEAGFGIAFAWVGMRPGKPTIFALKEGVPAFCLPGNPLSHYVAFQLFVRRALLALQGGRQEAAEREAEVEWDAPVSVRGSGGRETYHPCHWQIDAGRVDVRVLHWTSSGHLVSLLGANGMLMPGAGSSMKSGARTENNLARLVWWP